jgi:ribosomal-protein-alanine N-acetyltransferase
MSWRLRRVETRDLALLARLHGAAFPDDRWDERALLELLAMSGTTGHLVENTGAILGFIIDMVIAGEAEVLTLAVATTSRRQGVARALLEDLFRRAAAAGAGNVGLEVAADNDAALRLYAACGFIGSGRRRDYYRRGAETIDALLFRRTLSEGRPQ